MKHPLPPARPSPASCPAAPAGTAGISSCPKTTQAKTFLLSFDGVYMNAYVYIDGAYHLTSYDTSAVGWGITAHESIHNTYRHDCVAGEFVWTGFDYLGEPTPWNGTGPGDSGRGAIPNSSYFGIVETTGFPKDSYYLYRSQWNKRAVTVHLVTAWDPDNQYLTGGKIPVWLYSNAPRVELYRNGELIGAAVRRAVTSAATRAGIVPALPDTVRGVLADGTLAGEFPVAWNAPAADAYGIAGGIVTVSGTAAIFGSETMDVTCTVRVAGAVNTGSVNIAPQADTLRRDSDAAGVTLTLTWATARMISHVNLVCCSGSACPGSLEFRYSLNGRDYTAIGHTARLAEDCSQGAIYTCTFDEPINPVALLVKLSRPDGSCVDLIQLEVMTYAAEFAVNASTDLSAIAVDGTKIEGFAPDVLTYAAPGVQSPPKRKSTQALPSCPRRRT